MLCLGCSKLDKRDTYKGTEGVLILKLTQDYLDEILVS